jgi:LuxR family transcriptional regulator, maltose regulon positive regulatory protein
LDEAGRLYIRTPLPDSRPISTMKARIWLLQGRLAQAIEWAREQRLSSDDDLNYLREYDYLTLARILIAQYQSGRIEGPILAAMRLLDRLLKAAEEGSRMGSVIEILVLHALAAQAQGTITPALASLEQALNLARPEGYVGIFVDEGPPMTALLREATKHGIAPKYVSQLLTVSGEPESKKILTQPLVESASLIETLSERELDVLRLLRSDLNGPEIARELMVSLNTVRTHTQKIFAKLAVNNRRAAVRRAEELNLL